MNKYQKSLDVLKGLVLSTPILIKDFKKDFDTLQELIDNQADYMSYQDLKADYKKEIARLNKALDKACKELAKLEKLFLDAGGYEEFGCKEERWKEWLLHEN